MYIPHYPEDSTLRRHYESAARFRRQTRLAQPPTESVLRRHHEQLSTQASAIPVPSAATAAPSDQIPAIPTTRSGLFGWLRRLFG